MATFTLPDGRAFVIADPWYLASCDGCGWIGSTEECPSDCDDEVYCPKCHQSGASCGRVAEQAKETP